MTPLVVTLVGFLTVQGLAAVAFALLILRSSRAEGRTDAWTPQSASALSTLSAAPPRL